MSYEIDSIKYPTRINSVIYIPIKRKTDHYRNKTRVDISNNSWLYYLAWVGLGVSFYNNSVNRPEEREYWQKYTLACIGGIIWTRGIVGPILYEDELLIKTETTPLTHTDFLISINHISNSYKSDAAGAIDIDLINDFQLSKTKLDSIQIGITNHSFEISEKFVIASKSFLSPHLEITKPASNIWSTTTQAIISKCYQGEVYRIVKRKGDLLEIVLENGTGRLHSSVGEVWYMPEKPRPAYPPVLAIESPGFQEPGGNNKLDAEETGEIYFTVNNSGEGAAYDVFGNLSLTRTKGLVFDDVIQVGDIHPGKKRKVRFPISATDVVEEGPVIASITFKEKYNQPPGDLSVTFNTREFQAPNLALGPYICSPSGSDAILHAGEVFTLTMSLINTGTGSAKSILFKIDPPEKIHIAGEHQTEFTLAELAGRQQYDFITQFYSDRDYQSDFIEFNISATEKKGRYGFEILKEIPIRPYAGGSVVIVEPGEDIELPEPPEPTEVFPISDIDIDIPAAATLRPNAIGVIIGISKYSHPDVPQVDYARRDALLMKEYLIKSMGFSEENIILAVDQEATKGTFNRIFEGQLGNYIKPGVSDVFVYYSGHGAPDLENASAYFVAHDTDPNYAAQTGYSLDRFYRELDALDTKSVTVVLDACFSGASDAGMLIQSASPIFISVESPAANLSNGVVLTSSSGEQISSWYRDVGHGLFTYYFLKGIRGEADGDQDSKVTSAEVFGYILEHVPYLARRLYNREQTPQLMGGDLDQIIVEY